MRQSKGKRILSALLAIAASVFGQTRLPFPGWPSRAPAETATALVSWNNPSEAGGAVTFTAVVTAGEGEPAGVVEFLDGPSLLATASLFGGQASVTTDMLAPGGHSIVACYGGNVRYEASCSHALIQGIARRATATSLIPSANAASAGLAITLIATVTAAEGGPAGYIEFQDGGSLLATVDLAGGQASLTTSLTPGTHFLTASYGGDETFAPSVSPALAAQTVSNPPAIIALFSSSNPVTAGQPVTFTTVVAAAGGMSAGGVQFFDGPDLLESAALTGGSASFTAASLSVGVHSIAVNYGGLFTAIEQQVDPHSVWLSWIASDSPGVRGYNVYRSDSSGGPYARLNSAAVTSVRYVDLTVASGRTYYYVCTALDADNHESAHSNEARAAVP